MQLGKCQKCDEMAHARDLCAKHYKAWKRSGAPHDVYIARNDTHRRAWYTCPQCGGTPQATSWVCANCETEWEWSK